MKTTKVTIDGTNYDVNLDEAKRLGLIKETIKFPTNILHGDVYTSGHGTIFVIFQIFNNNIVIT